MTKPIDYVAVRDQIAALADSLSIDYQALAAYLVGAVAHREAVEAIVSKSEVLGSIKKLIEVHSA